MRPSSTCIRGLSRRMQSCAGDVDIPRSGNAKVAQLPMSPERRSFLICWLSNLMWSESSGPKSVMKFRGRDDSSGKFSQRDVIARIILGKEFPRGVIIRSRGWWENCRFLNREVYTSKLLAVKGYIKETAGWFQLLKYIPISALIKAWVSCSYLGPHARSQFTF